MRSEKKIETHADLAEFLERLLRGEFEGTWLYDDLESIPLAKEPQSKLWKLEKWRRCILDVAFAKNPPEGHWMHPDARLHIERIMEALRYIDENRNANS